MRYLLLILLCFATAIQTGSGAAFFGRPAAGGGPTTLFTDDFNRGDSTSIGATWVEVHNDAAIVGNKVRVGTGSSSPGMVFTTTTAMAATADVTVQVTQASAVGDGGPCARVTESDATPTMYAIDLFSGSMELHRFNNSAVGTLEATGSITQVANGVIKLVVSGSGATVTCTGFYQGAQIWTTGDTEANRITAAGQTGIHQWDSSGTATIRDYDDFSVTTP